MGIATEAIQVQITAFIQGWQREITENRQDAARGKREGTAEGNDLYRYHQGYADALDRCVQALRMLEDSHRYPAPLSTALHSRSAKP